MQATTTRRPATCTDRDQLRWLIMREAEGGLVFPFEGKFLELGEYVHRLAEQQLHPFAQQNEIGVVTHIATRRAEVDDGHRFGGHLSVGVHVGHYVVSQLVLVLAHDVEVDVVDVRAHLLQLLVRNGQTQFLLPLGQGNPASAPRGEFFLRAPMFGHFPRRETLNQGRSVFRRHAAPARFYSSGASSVAKLKPFLLATAATAVMGFSRSANIPPPNRKLQASAALAGVNPSRPSEAMVSSS